MPVAVAAPQGQKKSALDTAAQVMNLGIGAANVAGGLSGLMGGPAAPAADPGKQSLGDAAGVSNFGDAMQRRYEQLNMENRNIGKTDSYGLGVAPQPNANPGLGVVPQQQSQYGLFKR